MYSTTSAHLLGVDEQRRTPKSRKQKLEKRAILRKQNNMLIPEYREMSSSGFELATLDRNSIIGARKISPEEGAHHHTHADNIRNFSCG